MRIAIDAIINDRADEVNVFIYQDWFLAVSPAGNHTHSFAPIYTPHINPSTGVGVCSLVNRETLLELRSEIRLDAVPTTTIGFSGIRTRNSLRANLVFLPLSRLSIILFLSRLFLASGFET